MFQSVPTFKSQKAVNSKSPFYKIHFDVLFQIGMNGLDKWEDNVLWISEALALARVYVARVMVCSGKMLSAI